MKRSLVFLIVLTASVFTAMAATDKLITADELPTSAKTFISQYFSNSDIALVKLDNDWTELKYTVLMADGRKVDFDRNGNWKEIDCGNMPVPEAVIPEKILSMVKNNYASAYITEIDRDKRDYEIKLSNGLELTFDLQFNLIDIDN